MSAPRYSAHSFAQIKRRGEPVRVFCRWCGTLLDITHEHGPIEPCPYGTQPEPVR